MSHFSQFCFGLWSLYHRDDAFSKTSQDLRFTSEETDNRTSLKNGYHETFQVVLVEWYESSILPASCLLSANKCRILKGRNKKGLMITFPKRTIRNRSRIKRYIWGSAVRHAKKYWIWPISDDLVSFKSLNTLLGYSSLSNLAIVFLLYLTQFMILIILLIISSPNYFNLATFDPRAWCFFFPWLSK